MKTLFDTLTMREAPPLGVPYRGYSGDDVAAAITAFAGRYGKPPREIRAWHGNLYLGPVTPDGRRAE